MANTCAYKLLTLKVQNRNCHNWLWNEQYHYLTDTTTPIP